MSPGWRLKRWKWREGNMRDDSAAELLPSNRARLSASLRYHVGTAASLKPILLWSLAGDDDGE